jgi:protein deglycase
MSKRALIILADGFEEIEAVTPIDILRRAQIDVIVAGLGNKTVTGSRGVKITADILLDELHQEIDVLVLPGGSPGAEHLAKSKKVAGLINKMFKAGKIIAAICASPALVLEPTGILKNKKATCYPGMEKLFSQDVKFSKDALVRDGNIITGRGPGTALSFALSVVEALTDKPTAAGISQRVLG